MQLPRHISLLLEEFQDHLCRLVCNRQRLHAKLLLNLEGLDFVEAVFKSASTSEPTPLSIDVCKLETKDCCWVMRARAVPISEAAAVTVEIAASTCFWYAFSVA